MPDPEREWQVEWGNHLLIVYGPDPLQGAYDDAVGRPAGSRPTRMSVAPVSVRQFADAYLRPLARTIAALDHRRLQVQRSLQAIRTFLHTLRSIHYIVDILERHTQDRPAAERPSTLPEAARDLYSTGAEALMARGDSGVLARTFPHLQTERDSLARHLMDIVQGQGMNGALRQILSSNVHADWKRALVRRVALFLEIGAELLIGTGSEAAFASEADAALHERSQGLLGTVAGALRREADERRARVSGALGTLGDAADGLEKLVSFTGALVHFVAARRTAELSRNAAAAGSQGRSLLTVLVSALRGSSRASSSAQNAAAILGEARPGSVQPIHDELLSELPEGTAYSRASKAIAFVQALLVLAHHGTAEREPRSEAVERWADITSAAATTGETTIEIVNYFGRRAYAVRGIPPALYLTRFRIATEMFQHFGTAAGAIGGMIDIVGGVTDICEGVRRDQVDIVEVSLGVGRIGVGTAALASVVLAGTGVGAVLAVVAFAGALALDAARDAHRSQPYVKAYLRNLCARLLAQRSEVRSVTIRLRLAEKVHAVERALDAWQAWEPRVAYEQAPLHGSQVASMAGGHTVRALSPGGIRAGRGAALRTEREHSTFLQQMGHRELARRLFPGTPQVN